MRMSDEAKRINEAIQIVQRLAHSDQVNGNELVADGLSKMELGLHRQLQEIQNRPKRRKKEEEVTLG